MLILRSRIWSKRNWKLELKRGSLRDQGSLEWNRKRNDETETVTNIYTEKMYKKKS